MAYNDRAKKALAILRPLLASMLVREDPAARPRRNAPPLPCKLPGKYFVLLCNKNAENYTIVLDDETHSSYKLLDVQRALLQFKRWGHGRFGADALDMAKEFGNVQAVFQGERLIADCFRRAEPPKQAGLTEEAFHAPTHYNALPPL